MSKPAVKPRAVIEIKPKKRTEIALPSQAPLKRIERPAVPQLEFTAENIELIKRQIAKEATDDELKMFLYHCKKTGLDPLAKQIYFMKVQGRPCYITAIDGFRLTAGRTGEHAGTDDTVFDNEKEPNKATTTVYRMTQGVRYSYTATARWDEYCPAAGKDFMWKKMPCTMLGKCSEALALRKAFPNELGGTYVKEEMDQAQAQGEFSTRPQSPNEEDGNTDPQANGYRIPFGQWRQRSLEEIGPDKLRKYIVYLETEAKKKGKEISGDAVEFIERASDYIAAFENITPGEEQN